MWIDYSIKKFFDQDFFCTPVFLYRNFNISLTKIKIILTFLSINILSSILSLQGPTGQAIYNILTKF